MSVTRAQSAAQSGVAVEKASNGGWVQLFNGRNLDGWYTFLSKSGKNNDPGGSVRVENGMIHILGNPAARDRAEAGYLATNEEYANYRLRVEYKWGTARFAPREEFKRDNGVLFHIVGADRVWPTCVEFQIQETDVGDAIPVNGTSYIAASQPGNGLPAWPNPPNKNIATPSYERLAYKMGDFENREGWNVVELIARGDKAAFVVNGRINNTIFKMQRLDSPVPLPPPYTPERARMLANGPMVPLNRGKIAIEVEYAETWFR
jgi:hypothetical protein